MQMRDSIGSYLVQLDLPGTGTAPPLDLNVSDPLGYVADEATLRGSSIFGALADPPILTGGASTNPTIAAQQSGQTDAGIGSDPIAGTVQNVGALGDYLRKKEDEAAAKAKALLWDAAFILIAGGVILIGVYGLLPART